MGIYNWNGYSVQALNDTFTEICDPDDWKAPIRTVVEVEKVGLVVNAIRYMTAIEPKVSHRLAGYMDGKYVVESEGYRLGPAGDH